jgi:hypothetical protein
MSASPAITAALEDQLLAEVIAPFDPDLPNDPASLAERFDISLRLVLDFLASPSTRARIAAAVESSDLAFHHKAQQAKARALSALEDILDSTDDQVEKRRAAAAILRIGRPVATTHRDRTAPPAASTPHNTKPLKEPPPLPRTEFCSQSVVLTVLERLQDNDNPTPNAGLATLRNFIHPHSSLGVRMGDPAEYVKNPGDDLNLVNFTSSIFEPLRPQVDDPTDPDCAKHLVNLYFPDNGEIHAVFTLRRHANQYNQKYWLISAIDYLPDIDDDDDADNDTPAATPEDPDTAPLDQDDTELSSTTSRITRIAHVRAPLLLPAPNTS